MDAHTEPQVLAVRPPGAAALLGVSVRTVYNLMADGRLPYRQLGAARLIELEQLRRLLASLPSPEPRAAPPPEGLASGDACRVAS